MADAVSVSDSASVIGGVSQAQRQHLNRIVIETSALLNIVKHCREGDQKAQVKGNLMGVLKEDNTLMVTQALAEVNKALY